jgi:hypothetical protein
MPEVPQAGDQPIREADTRVGPVVRHAGTFTGQAHLLHALAIDPGAGRGYVVRGAIVPYAAAR